MDASFLAMELVVEDLFLELLCDCVGATDEFNAESDVQHGQLIDRRTKLLAAKCVNRFFAYP